MNRPIMTISAPAVHIPGANLDTDRIIPARFLKTVTFENLGDALFCDDRLTAEGTWDPKHPLHQTPKAGILVVDENFGCGSSREHAAQAILRWGIRALIGRSFGDIFRGNCSHLGIPCLEIDEVQHEDLVQIFRDKPVMIEISLTDLTVHEPKSLKQWTCRLSSDSQAAFISGSYDPLQSLLTNQEQVRNYGRNRFRLASKYFQGTEPL